MRKQLRRSSSPTRRCRLSCALAVRSWSALRVVVPIRNVDDEPISVLVQAAFLDNQRQPLPDETNRQVLLLPPGGTSNFEAISRQSRASDFVVRLSWNK